MATKIRSVLEKIANKQTVEFTKQASESAKAVFGLAKTVKEKPLDRELLKTVQPYVGQFSSLLDMLNSPLGLMVKEVIPFAPIAVTLLNLLCEVTRKDPTLEECMALVVQAAYLDSLRSYLAEHETLLSQVGEAQASESVSQQIRKLGELEIGDREARKAILFFHESEIAKAFTAVLEARLLEAQVSNVRSITEQVSRNTNYHIQTALAGMSDKVNPVVKWFSSGGQEKFEQYLSIEEYLRDVISPDSTIPVLRDRWRVFNEPFTLKEIYVPTEARFINKDGKQDKKRDPVVLEQWAKAWLNQPNQSKVLFIQGHPGRGKSVFCRMFAEWVRQEQHPNWTPILIRLRDIQSLEKDFEETLRKAVNKDFASSDDGWLSNRNTQFLFLLDGFDELLMQGRTSRGLEEFLEQVERFQRRCQENPEKGHRILVTGRTLSLQCIESRMPTNLERLEIIEMSTELQERWFAKWVQLFGSEKTNAFQRFLRCEQCPERVRELSREPLLLYLLAAMHRDGELTLSAFEGAEGVQAKILIYEKTIDWVLTKQRRDLESNLNDDITELNTESLRMILMEAGLSAVQAGGECAPISMIEARLKSNTNVQRMLEEARQRINDNPLRNALAAFYLQPGSQSGSVEFIHKSFGEFLCAERLKEALEDWTRPGERRRQTYLVEDNTLYWEIYDLLGSPVLTPEIVEYLIALLSQSDEFKPVELFERLHEFYEQWYEGEFIDAPPENLPQKKMRLLREQLLDQEKPLGLRQVDVYVGLNVMILLLELHRYGQYVHETIKSKIVFHPGSLGKGFVNKAALFRIINYCESAFCRSLDTSGSFSSIAGSFLANANLAELEFCGLGLSGTNFSKANLTDANFFRAFCGNSDFSFAVLHDALLNQANFSGSDLSGAAIVGASLAGADLRGTNLSNADLTDTILSDIFWNKNTIWEGVQGLERAIDVPSALKQQLGLE